MRAVLVIGQQKAATSFAFAVLLRLLNVTRPQKELHVFESPVCRQSSACVAEMAAHVGRDGFYLDGTPDYYASMNAFHALSLNVPFAVPLLVLRDPVDRARAAWAQNRAAGASVEAQAVAREMLDSGAVLGDAGNLPPGWIKVSKRRGGNAVSHVDHYWRA